MPSDSTGTDHGIELESVDDAVGTESNGDRSDRSDGSPTVADDRVADLERRIVELEADLDAVRGLLDGVDAVGERVERRASTALAKAEALEARVGAGEPGLVRERLPDARDPNATNSGDSATDAEDHAAATDAPSERAPATQRSDDLRDGSVGRHSGGSPGGEGPTASRGGGARTRGHTDPDTAESGGTGAISSVGGAGRGVDDAHSGGYDGTRDCGGATDTDGDRSLASRLRDAFR